MNGAVVGEMARLDPDAVVVKGDLTDRGLPEQYEAFLRVYGSLGARMRHVRGNHDAIADPELAIEGAPYAIELGGVTLAVLDTTVPGRVGGALPAGRSVGSTTSPRALTGPVLVFGHHPVANLDAPERSDPSYVIAFDDSVALADGGRTTREHRGLLRGPHPLEPRVPLRARPSRPFVEVACAKDYPGAWAEYRVYEGGYTQVMRRVADPAAVAWSEQARTMIQGIYRDLVLGDIDARCFTELF